MPLNTTTRNRRSIAQYYYTNGMPSKELHDGAWYKLEPPSLDEHCSGKPPHHLSTVFPACRDFRDVGAFRPGMICPAERMNSGKLKG